MHESLVTVHGQSGRVFTRNAAILRAANFPSYSVIEIDGDETDPVKNQVALELVSLSIQSKSHDGH